jgi:hypothetical protein
LKEEQELFNLFDKSEKENLAVSIAIEEIKSLNIEESKHDKDDFSELEVYYDNNYYWKSYNIDYDMSDL